MYILRVLRVVVPVQSRLHQSRIPTESRPNFGAKRYCYAVGSRNGSNRPADCRSNT